MDVGAGSHWAAGCLDGGIVKGDDDAESCAATFKNYPDDGVFGGDKGGG